MTSSNDNELKVNNGVDDTMEITDTARPAELNIITATTLRVNGIEYAPEYTTEGLKIPVPITDPLSGTRQAYYQMIPRKVLIDMLTDLFDVRKDQVL